LLVSPSQDDVTATKLIALPLHEDERPPLVLLQRDERHASERVGRVARQLNGHEHPRLEHPIGIVSDRPHRQGAGRFVDHVSGIENLGLKDGVRPRRALERQRRVGQVLDRGEMLFVSIDRHPDSRQVCDGQNLLLRTHAFQQHDIFRNDRAVKRRLDRIVGDRLPLGPRIDLRQLGVDKPQDLEIGFADSHPRLQLLDGLQRDRGSLQHVLRDLLDQRLQRRLRGIQFRLGFQQLPARHHPILGERRQPFILFARLVIRDVGGRQHFAVLPDRLVGQLAFDPFHRRALTDQTDQLIGVLRDRTHPLVLGDREVALQPILIQLQHRLPDLPALHHDQQVTGLDLIAKMNLDLVHPAFHQRKHVRDPILIHHDLAGQLQRLSQRPRIHHLRRERNGFPHRLWEMDNGRLLR